MKKKYLLFIIAFSFIAHANTPEGEQNIQPDPFAELRSDLHELRKDADNAMYANIMVDGIEAIDKAKNNKIDAIEKIRQTERNKISSAKWYLFWSRPEMDSWFYAETPDTMVYQADLKNNNEHNKLKQDYNKLADMYKNYTLFMHNELAKEAQKNLAEKVAPFETMHRALQKCKGDHDCYKRQGAPSYRKIANPNYRSNIQDEHYAAALETAHAQNIPVTGDELRLILRKNKEYNETMTKIVALNAAIDDMVNPDKIKEREEKSIKELEEQKAKEEEEKKQALKDELQQTNVPVDSNPTTE